MSQANVNYVLKHNPEINKNKVEIFPNCIEPRDMSISDKEKRLIRNKYGLPIDKTIFVYGGNLGKPQGIDFLIKCLRSQKNNLKSFFLIIGDGTEYSKLEKFMNEQKQENVKLLRRLPKEDYDKMIGSCDVGMIFLDYRFTIPNFPSRLLSYMQAKLPILAVTDTNSDIGEVIEGGKFGWWCESKNVENFNLTINKIFTEDFIDKGKNAYDYLLNCYSVNKECKKILNGGK